MECLNLLEKVKFKDGEKMRIKIEKNDDIDQILNKYCGLLESEITLNKVKKMRAEAKTWKGSP